MLLQYLLNVHKHCTVNICNNTKQVSLVCNVKHIKLLSLWAVTSQPKERSKRGAVKCWTEQKCIVVDSQKAACKEIALNFT